ncbi:hypothetical protein [Streptomyces sp. CAU 1734]|uniref:hypothetical protein n=1 Tax=Streptomyces sp. CAU 1734 TaxID=3140360 RepID=UPI0032606594
MRRHEYEPGESGGRRPDEPEGNRFPGLGGSRPGAGGGVRAAVRLRTGERRPGRRVAHEFLPGRLIAGLTAIAATLVYAGDAAGSWRTPWYAMVPLVLGGLFLAGGAGAWHYTARRRRAASSASAESVAAPASTSGSQAMR